MPALPGICSQLGLFYLDLKQKQQKLTTLVFLALRDATPHQPATGRLFPPSHAELLSVTGAYNKQAATGLADTGTMPPSAYVSEKDGNSDV